MKEDRPILKWPGGKRRLVHAIVPRLPSGTRLVEPFVGSGAVFLASDYSEYLLCDANADLILFYQSLRNDGENFIERCRALFDGGNSQEAFYDNRDRFNAGATGSERGALFLYLNRHGYNGLIRYNSKGFFNVPFGRFKQPRFPAKEMAYFLTRTRRSRVELRAQDFRQTFAALRPGDVVYCDPPYIPLSKTANFTAYEGTVFGVGDQDELARLAARTALQGIRLVMSNHLTPATRELYTGASEIHEINVRRCISCNSDKREMVGEMLAVY